MYLPKAQLRLNQIVESDGRDTIVVRILVMKSNYYAIVEVTCFLLMLKFNTQVVIERPEW